MNLQVVAVGCYDVAGEVAVAAVVGDWKGFREGFPGEIRVGGKMPMEVKVQLFAEKEPGQCSSLSLLCQFVHHTLQLPIHLFT